MQGGMGNSAPIAKATAPDQPSTGHIVTSSDGLSNGLYWAYIGTDNPPRDAVSGSFANSANGATGLVTLDKLSALRRPGESYLARVHQWSGISANAPTMLTDDITVMILIRYDEIDLDTGYLFEVADSGFSYSVGMQVSMNGGLLKYEFNDYLKGAQLFSDTAVVADEWTCFALRYTASNNVIKMLLNGIEQSGSYTYAGSGALLDRIAIYATQNTNTDAEMPALAGAAAWSRALTNAELLHLSQTGQRFSYADGRDVV